MSQLDDSKLTCADVCDILEEDPTEEASRAVLEHLVDCEACRATRAELLAATRTASSAGADYVHPTDFMERFSARLQDLEATSGTADPTRAESIEQGAAVDGARAPEAAVDQRSESAPDSTARSHAVLGLAPELKDKLRPLFDGRGHWWALGMVAATLLVLWSSQAGRGLAPSSEEQRPQWVPLAEDTGPWTGQVSALAALREGGSVSACDADGEDCRALHEGERFSAGSTIKTDPQARVKLSLADGSEVVLGRSTSLRLADAQERSATLLSGQAVFDVRKDESERATVSFPHGRVEVVGTKFSLRSELDSSWVSVTRGKVRVVDGSDRGVTLTAGQGTRVGGEEAPVARHLVSLSNSFAWSERGFEPEQESPEAAPRGLGELRAKKPGEKDERKDAVTLTRQKVKVRISGAMARTEIEQEFENHTDEVLEGIYRFPLPPGAQIERLALEVDGRWEEGAFVDRERAAAIWRGAIVNSAKKKPPVVDDIVWVPGPWKDPALLEWQRGGSFELRIFPIPKRGSRRIVLSYTEWLEPEADTRRYTYPLPHDAAGSVNVDDFAFDVQVQGHLGQVSTSGIALEPAPLDVNGDFDGVDKERLLFQQRGFTPAGDVMVEFGTPTDELRSWAYRDEGSGETYVALALRPELPQASSDEEQSYVIVVDRSRSMYGEHYQRATRLATRIIRELDPRFRVGVLACDATCQADSTLLDVAGESAAQRARSFLEGQTVEGASDLVHALRTAGQWLRGSGRGRLNVIYLGDGAPTAGAIQPALIRQQLARSLPSQISVTAVTVGSTSDDAALRAATDQSGGVLMRFASGRTLSEVAYDVLAATTGQALEHARVQLPSGVSAAAPAHLGTIAAGGEAVVVAKFEGSEVSGPVVLEGSLGGTTFERRYQLDVQADAHRGNAFLPRLYASKRIAELETEPSADAKKRAIELSERFNVASRHTSLLVLESPAMFKAFGLKNERLAPLWTGEEASFEGDAVASPGRLGSVGSGLGLGDDPADFASGGGVSRSAPVARSAPRAMPKSKKPALSAPRASCPPGDPFCGPSEAKPNPFPDDELAPTPPPVRREVERARSRCTCPAGDMACAMRCDGLGRPPPRPRPRRMVPMRRVWQSSGKILQHGIATSDSGLSAKEEALRRQPQSRRALAELYAAYMAAGELDRAAELAERWSDKDPLDPDALTARADVAAQRGERDLAIRILGSVVDVRPDEHQAQWRLARLFRWAGELDRSCAHYVAVAQLRSDDAEALADALRCAKQMGDDSLAADLRLGANDNVRRRAERLEGKAVETGLRGEFRAVATWGDSSQDLDVVFIHPAGYRVSWLGAPTRAVISAEDVESTHRDALALRGVRAGRYGIEIVRGGPTQGPVSGNLEIQFRDGRRTFPFVLQGDRVRVADVDVTMRQVLVPL